MSGGGKVVCVTGASGYISVLDCSAFAPPWLHRQGHRSRPKGPEENKHLLALDGANERLKLFKADLLEECSFEQAIKGCDAVFHTASPVSFTVTDPQSWYSLSKTLAENAAWQFAKDNGIDMVVINPGF